MTQSFSMGVRQRGDMRNTFIRCDQKSFPHGGTLEPTGSESMKVLAHTYLTGGWTLVDHPSSESVRDRCVAGRVGCEDSSPDAPRVLESFPRKEIR